MRVIVGSENPVKLAAVREVLAAVEALEGASVRGVSVPSGVPEQPRGLDETFRGARGRAAAALAAAPGALAIGLEDGMYPCPADPAQHLNVCVACVMDAEKTRFGTSSSFTYPEAVVRRVLDDGLDVSQALRAAGYTEATDIGRDVGAIGVLSHGRLVRKDYTMQAVTAAILPWL